MLKRRINVKKGRPVLYASKNFIKNWFVVCKLDYSTKIDEG